MTPASMGSTIMPSPYPFGQLYAPSAPVGVGFGYGGFGYGGYGGGYGIPPYGAYPTYMPYAQPLVFGSPEYYNGGTYQQPRNLRADISEAQREHPDIDPKALQEVGRVLRANPNIGKNPQAMDNFRERMDRRFGTDETNKALAALGVGEGKKGLSRTATVPYAGTTPASSQRHTSHKAHKARPAAQRSSQPQASSGGMSILGWLGVLIGGVAGWKMMNSYGDGINATSLIVMGVVAAVGGMIGNAGGYALTNLAHGGKSQNVARGRRQTASLPMQGQTEEIHAPETSPEKMAALAEQYRRPQETAALMQGVDVTGPVTSGVPLVAQQKPPKAAPGQKQTQHL